MRPVARLPVQAPLVHQQNGAAALLLAHRALGQHHQMIAAPILDHAQRLQRAVIKGGSGKGKTSDDDGDEQILKKGKIKKKKTWPFSFSLSFFFAKKKKKKK